MLLTTMLLAIRCWRHRLRSRIVSLTLLAAIAAGFFLAAMNWGGWRWKRMSSLHFDGFDNENGSTVPVIPDVVHILIFAQSEITFTQFVCLLSLLKNHNPGRVLVHSDRNLSGDLWASVLAAHSGVSQVSLTLPTHVYGEKLSSIFHASDVARLLVLMRHGGIYLDSDVFVVRSLRPFLRFEMVLGMQDADTIGSQVLMAHPEARLLKFWFKSYQKYRPGMWYYNAGRLPAEILSSFPHLAHVEPHAFGVENLASMLYGELSDRWLRYFTIHLLTRHRRYLNADDFELFPVLDSNNIWRYNKTFGAMARSVLEHWNISSLP